MAKSLKKPPTRIEEHDRAIIALSAERAARLKAQHDLAVAHANNIAAQSKAHGEHHVAAIVALRKKYGLVEADAIELETGNIVRASPPKPGPATEE